MRDGWWMYVVFLKSEITDKRKSRGINNMYMNGGKLIGHTLLVSTQMYVSVQLHLLHISRVFIKKKSHSIFSCLSVKVPGEHLTI